MNWSLLLLNCLVNQDEVPEDIPEEFLDPIMADLMNDPVRLPCGNVMERGYIERMLVS